MFSKVNLPIYSTCNNLSFRANCSETHFILCGNNYCSALLFLRRYNSKTLILGPWKSVVEKLIIVSGDFENLELDFKFKLVATIQAVMIILGFRIGRCRCSCPLRCCPSRARSSPSQGCHLQCPICCQGIHSWEIFG